MINIKIIVAVITLSYTFASYTIGSKQGPPENISLTQELVTMASMESNENND